MNVCIVECYKWIIWERIYPLSNFNLCLSIFNIVSFIMDTYNLCPSKIDTTFQANVDNAEQLMKFRILKQPSTL